MKFYIASRFKLKDKVGDIYELLRSKGHETVTDWTKHKPVKPYKENSEFAEKYAAEDLRGVIGSDVFIIMSDDAGTGMHTELGAAIAENLRSGKPEIYVVGEHTSRSMFYFHPSVNKKENINQVLEELGV